MRILTVFACLWWIVTNASGQQPYEKLSSPNEKSSVTCNSFGQSFPDKGGWLRQSLSDTVIIFVHGILSDSRAAWLTTSEPCQFWPRLVASDTARLGAPDIFLGYYYAGLSSGTAKFEDLANALFTQISNSSAFNEIAPLARQKIVFIAHSLGGIVVRKMLASHKEKFSSKDVSVFLYASPSGGSQYADLLTWLKGFYKLNLLDQLSKDSDSLVQLKIDFNNFIKAQKERGRKADVIEFFEVRFPKEQCFLGFISCSIITGIMPEIVPQESSSGSSEFTGRIADTDHITIVKPHDLNSDSHQRLVFWMNKLGMAPATPGATQNIGSLGAKWTVSVGTWETDGPPGSLVTMGGKLCATPPCRQERVLPIFNNPPNANDSGIVILKDTPQTQISGTVIFGVEKFPTPTPDAPQFEGKPVFSEVRVFEKNQIPSPDGSVAAYLEVQYQGVRYRIREEERTAPINIIPPLPGQTITLSIPSKARDVFVTEKSIAGIHTRSLQDLKPRERLGVLVLREYTKSIDEIKYAFDIYP